MSRSPSYTRRSKAPLIVGTGLFAAAYFGSTWLFGGGNEHGASHTPSLDSIPSYAVEAPASSTPTPENVPPRAASFAGTVCHNMVFVDASPQAVQEVIVNPMVESGGDRPLDLVDINERGAQLSQPQPRSNFEVYKYIGGRLVKSGTGRLDGCLDATVNVASVQSGGESRPVLTDEYSKSHDGAQIAPDAKSAVEAGLVQTEFTMTPSQVDAFVRSFH